MIIKPKHVGGIGIYPFASKEMLLKQINADPKILIAINAEKILHSTPQMAAIINSNIGYADGIGATMALKKKGYTAVIKIPGCEIWLDIIKEFYQSKSFYFVGAKQEVIEKTIAQLQGHFPGIKILGYRNGYIKTKAEEEQLIDEIVHKKPDIVFVAMGSPKQELLMDKLQNNHRAIYQGLGGSFDVYVGNVKRAPKFWINIGLEWFYRLLSEPKRIKRQIHLVRFFWLLLLNKI